MHRVWILLTGLFLVVVMPASAQDTDGPPQVGLRPDAPEYALHGPYWVGTMEVVVNPDTARPLPTTVWYPAQNPQGLDEAIIYDLGISDLIPADLAYYRLSEMPGHALLDAAPDPTGGPYPLVIWSHGYGESRYYGAYIMEHLASMGFVVFAPSHPGNGARTAWENGDDLFRHVGMSAVLRPADVTAVIDFAFDSANGTGLDGMIDAQQIAVGGYSFGGYTALALGGARIDMTGACNDSRLWDGICAQVREMANTLGLDSVPAGLWPSQVDARVDAIVLNLPWVDWFGVEGVRSVTVPVLQIVGGGDTEVGGESVQRPIFEALDVDKALAVFVGGQHGVTQGGYDPPTSEAPWLSFYAADPAWDFDRAGDLANHMIAAFLLAQFDDDPDARAALAADAMQFDGILYTAEGF